MNSSAKLHTLSQGSPAGPAPAVQPIQSHPFSAHQQKRSSQSVISPGPSSGSSRDATPAYIDVYSHPAAVAYAAAHPRRTIPKFGPYLVLQTLEEGENGRVKLGLHSQGEAEVAIKLIRRASVDNKAMMLKVEREIQVLRVFKHPNIVRMYDVIETDKFIGIILEYVPGGELFDHIVAHRYLRERDAAKLFSQLVSGVWYMHQKKVIHRDLKLENLLLDSHRNLVIIDFGNANGFQDRADDLMQTSCGSPCYAAPELVMTEGSYFGSAVDVWSCGVILYAMLAGYLPFDDDPANPDSENINLLYKYIVNTPLSFPDYVSTEARNLIGMMLVPDPSQRGSLEAVMHHPWLSAFAIPKSGSQPPVGVPTAFGLSVEQLEHAALDEGQQRRLAFKRRMIAAQPVPRQQQPIAAFPAGRSQSEAEDIRNEYLLREERRRKAIEENRRFLDPGKPSLGGEETSPQGTTSEPSTHALIGTPDAILERPPDGKKRSKPLPLMPSSPSRMPSISSSSVQPGQGAAAAGVATGAITGGYEPYAYRPYNERANSHQPQKEQRGHTLAAGAATGAIGGGYGPYSHRLDNSGNAGMRAASRSRPPSSEESIPLQSPPTSSNISPLSPPAPAATQHQQRRTREGFKKPVEKPVEPLDTKVVDLAARLGALFADRSKYRQFLACRDSNAQGLLDMFQRLLDVLNFPPSSSFRRDLIVAIQRLAGASGLYPVCYELTNVTTGEFPKSSGSFADIYVGSFQGRAVCLKTIRLDMTTDMQHFLKVCSKEAVLWGQLSHPNLLPFYGIFRFGSRISMVSPWMEYGDINNYLKHHPSADRTLLAWDVAQGLLFLHENGIIHGDLKGPNILVNESGRACLADFGISSISDPQILAWTSHSAVASKGGSVRWQAPELFDPETEDDIHNTTASDVYAWSCVAYEIFAGHVPFVHIPRDTAVIFKVTKGERPARPSADLGLTDQMWSLMEDCWKAVPKDRPSVDRIIERLTSNLPRDTRPLDGQDGVRGLSPAEFREMTREGLTHDEMTAGTLERLLKGA